MKKGVKLVIALDWDNVLAPCTELACQKATERGYPVDVRDVTQYGFENFPKETSSMLMSIFDEPDFFDCQVPYPGAVEMVDELLEAEHQVVITSAPKANRMGFRAMQIAKFFPGINPNNIILGNRKDLLHVDVLLDDATYNIKSSPAKYPMMWNQPWNQAEKGYIRIPTYKKFLRIVEAISLAPIANIPRLSLAGHPGMVCLVGPSASGKSFICDELVKNPMFRKVKALTTRMPRPDGADYAEYKFVTNDEFDSAIARNDLVEHTTYAGHMYGIAKSEIQDIWNEGRIAVKPVDINGALACKQVYGERCVTVFVRRSKEAIMKSLLERDVPTEDKVNRLLSLDAELDNEHLCDWTVSNNGTLDHALQQVLRIVG